MEQRNELVRSRSDIPFVRAGLANFLAIHLVVVGTQMYFALESFSPVAQGVGLAAVALGFLAFYRSFVSRIVFRDDGVLFVRPFGRDVVPYADIERVTVRQRRVFSTLDISVRARRRRGSTYRIASTPWRMASLRDLEAWLASRFLRHGVATS
jgi:hypothetical protein